MKLNRALRKLRHRRGNVQIYKIYDGHFTGYGPVSTMISLVNHAPRYYRWSGDFEMRQDQIVKREGSGNAESIYYTTRRPSVKCGEKVPIREQMASWPPGTAWEVERWMGQTHGIACELVRIPHEH